MTERPNLQAEQVEFRADGRSLSAPVMDAAFFQQETAAQSQMLRQGHEDAASATVPSVVSAQQQQHIAGAGQFQPLHEEGQEWQHYNVVDLPLVKELSRRLFQAAGDGDMRMGADACSALSAGVQLHLRNVLEGAGRAMKCRMNRSSTNSYEGLAKMVLAQGRGRVLPENQSNIALVWGPDVRSVLQREEQEARQRVREASVAEEESLAADMRAYDEQRAAMSATTKRKMQDADVPWWQKEVAVFICAHRFSVATI